MAAIVDVQHVSFKYGTDTCVLQDVNIKLNHGDFAALIGPNGAGKSTLLRLLLADLSPSEGNVFLFGEDIRTFRRWTEVGYVAQNSVLKNSGIPATVEEIVMASQYNKPRSQRLSGKERRQRTMDALCQVGMADSAKKLMGKLSGGQQQRVMLARALVTQPRLMLLDEPVTGIDDKSVDMLYELLDKLNRETGLVLLMVTHDTTRVLDYVSRIFCLEQCSLVELTKSQVSAELCNKHSHVPHKHE